MGDVKACARVRSCARAFVRACARACVRGNPVHSLIGGIPAGPATVAYRAIVTCAVCRDVATVNVACHATVNVACHATATVACRATATVAALTATSVPRACRNARRHARRHAPRHARRHARHHPLFAVFSP